MSGLNSDLLQTFLAIAEAGSVTDGADRIHRSQSAASLQIKRLEEILGQSVFERHGRGVTLTACGERLLPIARDVTHQLNAVLREFSVQGLHGRLRIGIPDDQSPERISRIVGAFARTHPGVELEVICALSSGFAKAIDNGSLDIAIYEVENVPEGVEIIWEERTFWMTSRFHDLFSQDPVPVALFDRDCWWRDAALATLQGSKRTFRIAYSSQSVAGVAAAIEAGIAIGLLGEASLTDSLEILGPDCGIVQSPVSKLVLASNAMADAEMVDAMKAVIRGEFAGQRR